MCIIKKQINEINGTMGMRREGGEDYDGKGERTMMGGGEDYDGRRRGL